jgi:Ca-activated chloride channel family protein
MNRCQRFLPFVLCAPLAAQGLWIGPLPGPGVAPPDIVARRPGIVQIVRTGVTAEIVDGVATTTIDQVFRNGSPRDEEGTWFLPLPMGAVADGFTMTVGGKEVKGEVLGAGEARSIYESIVRQRRDPGLLEYAGEGLLRARIFPIPANGEVGVTVRLRQVIQPTGGLFEWVWPLRAAGLGDATVGPIGLHVRIKSQSTIATIVTPHAGAEIRRVGDREATVGLEGQVGQFEDLRVLYGLMQQDFGMHLLANRPAGEAGYFTMLVSPPRRLDDSAPLPRRFVQFVVDTSGSMAGDKIEQAKAALRTFLRSLRPQDVFQVVTFASSVQTFFERPRAASSENVEQALQRIERLQAMGGTDIAGALQQALEVSMPGDDDVLLPQIVFVTDGQPTVGLTAPQQILDLTKRLDRRATRVFALGVGDEIDVRLLDDLVQQHRGARDFVRNKEKIEVKVDALCQKIAQPALTDVEVRCDGIDAFDVHPARTNDLFCGEMLHVVGRYRAGGSRNVVVRGRQNGVQREFVFPVEFPHASEQHAFVQTLWARQHVAGLLDAIRRHGPKQELLDEVRRLATRYGIVTPYTSQLIVEEGMRLAGRPAADPLGATEVRRGLAPNAPAPAGPGGGVRRLEDFGRARTGGEAVEESLAADAGKSPLAPTLAAAAKNKDRDAELLRRAGGRVFVRAGHDLVEQGLPADWSHKATVVEAFSTAWLELARKSPALREILALGEHVVFRDGDRIVRVAPAPAAK